MTRVGWSSSATRLMPRRAARARWRRVLPDTYVAGPLRRRVSGARRRMGALRPRDWVAGSAVVAAVTGILLDGPMAGLVLSGYSALATFLILRGRDGRVDARSRRFAVDVVAELAAELRAGLPIPAALAAAEAALRPPMVSGPSAAAVVRRVAESIAVVESSGAPLADVLDRLDAHLRAGDRASAAAAAATAGVTASATLLAAMPLAGVATGFLIGADPLRVLLHTTVGAACLTVAMVLQCAGLAWAMRLSRVEVPR